VEKLTVRPERFLCGSEDVLKGVKCIPVKVVRKGEERGREGGCSNICRKVSWAWAKKKKKVGQVVLSPSQSIRTKSITQGRKVGRETVTVNAKKIPAGSRTASFQKQGIGGSGVMWSWIAGKLAETEL